MRDPTLVRTAESVLELYRTAALSVPIISVIERACRVAQISPTSDSFLHELLYRTIHAIGNVDLAVRADGNKMRLAEFADTFPGLSGRREDLAVQIQPQDLTGEAVHHVNLVFTDFKGARQTRVFQLSDEGSVGIEDLDSLILAIRNPEQAFGIDCDSVSHFELSGLLPLATPGLDELATLVEFQDASVAIRAGGVSLDDEDLSVATDRHVVRLVQQARSPSLVPLALLTLST